MTIVAGLDGTRKGWVCVVFDGTKVEGFGVRTFAKALEVLAGVGFIAVDMSIGFRDEALPGGRDCERQVRALMPGRASSVFSSPCRAALSYPDDYRQAVVANRASAANGAGLSKQSHAIFRKMLELDAVMTPELQDSVFEVHPEASFAALAAENESCINTSKKKPEGIQQRRRLLEAAGLAVGSLLQNRKIYGAGADDVLDAAVAAWSAYRRAVGSARCVPEIPPLDARGLRMEIWI